MTIAMSNDNIFSLRQFVRTMESSSRLLKELREIESDKRSGVSVELVDGKLTHLTGTLTGPESSPYEGGTFRIDIRLPSDCASYLRVAACVEPPCSWSLSQTPYVCLPHLLGCADPFEPPKMRFVTKVWYARRGDSESQPSGAGRSQKTKAWVLTVTPPASLLFLASPLLSGTRT